MKIEDIVKEVTPAGMDNLMINKDDFLELMKENKAVLLDIRMDFETKAWVLPMAINIPAPQLVDRLDELPKEKLIVVGCPTSPRSIPIAVYLKTQGFKSKFLTGGLVEMMAVLKGGKAKELFS